jgi:hypothetical protein
MTVNSKIKEVLFKYWKSNGVDTDESTLSLFGIDKGATNEIEDVQSLVIEYYGGRDEVLKKLKKLEGGTLYGETYGESIRGKVFNVLYDKGDKTFFCSVLVDGDGEIEIEDGKTNTIYNEYMDVGLDMAFRRYISMIIEDMLAEQITLKTGINIYLSRFEVSEPGKF